MKFPETESGVADESCGERGHGMFPLSGDRPAASEDKFGWVRVTGAQ